PTTTLPLGNSQELLGAKRADSQWQILVITEGAWARRDGQSVETTWQDIKKAATARGRSTTGNIYIVYMLL
ncbi:jg1140, partial [Pararge aegeria aegeria]